MSVFGRIRDYFIQALSVTDEKAWNPHLWNLYGSQSVAGEQVDEYTALTYSAFFNAVSIISETTASLPCHLYQEKVNSTTGKKKNRVASDRRMYRVLHDEFNPYMTAMAGRECLMSHVLTWGNGFAEKVRNSYGELIELWPITPNRVKIEVDGNGDLVYRIRVDNKDIYLPRENVLHIPGLGFDGLIGYSRVALARKSIGLSMALETFGSLYFGQGTHPGVIVSHPAKLSTTASSNLKDSLSAGYSGLGKSHRLLLLEEGMKIEKIGIPPDDSQFLESRQFQIPEIARWFNLPPHKLKDLQKSSFNNIEEEQISFVRDCIVPWLVRFEQNFNMQLLTDSDKYMTGRGRLYWKHNIKGLLRGDVKSQGQFYKDMFGIGAFSVNDIMELEDMDPVEGGDKRFVPLNMIPLEDAGMTIEIPSRPGNGDGRTDNTDNTDNTDARRMSR